MFCDRKTSFALFLSRLIQGRKLFEFLLLSFHTLQLFLFERKTLASVCFRNTATLSFQTKDGCIIIDIIILIAVSCRDYKFYEAKTTLS